MPQKRIKRNIEEFAKKIFDLVSDATEEGHQRLISLFESAKARYVWESYRCIRSSEFDTTIMELKNFPESINCLQVLANFVSSGGWSSNSANTLLFFELIQATGYKREPYETDAYLQQQVVTELKDSLCDLIVKRVLEYESDIKAADLKQQQLDAMRTIKPQNLITILLCDSHELAKETQRSNPEKMTFCLICNPAEGDKASVWQLFWYDLLGRANFLPTGNELRSLLLSLKINQLPNPNLDSYDQIKVCCSKLIGMNSDMYLFADGETAGKFSTGHPGKHSFCLSPVSSSRGSDSLKWQLTWHDLQGKPNHLSIHSGLAQLIGSLKDGQLPAADTLMHYKIKQECATLVNELRSKVTVLINPESDSLKGLTGAYVLTRGLPGITLQWYDNLGICQDIMLGKYPALNVWLNEQTTLSIDALPQLKTYLMHLNVRREVDESKQTNILGLLQKQHGITLLTANDLSKVPAFKLIAGVYILMREPLDNTGDWVLYLRHKGGVNERINTTNWGAFHQILLEKNELMPDALPITTKNALRNAITSALCDINTTSRCMAVNKFLPEQAGNYKAGSFVITKEAEVWSLYYITTLQKALRVNLQDYPDVRMLLGKYDGEPVSLGSSIVSQIDKSLVDFKPKSLVNLADYSKLSCLLSKQVTPSPQHKSDSPGPNKLNMKNYVAIGGLFGNIASSSKKESEVTQKNKLSS